MNRLLLACILVLPAAAIWAQTDNQQKFRLTGAVVNSAGGEPVGGALVALTGAEAHSVMAGSDGHFELDELPGGVLFLTARRPGFAPPAQPQRVTVGPSTDPVVIKLVPFAKISGVVTDRDGDPIGGIDIQCLRQALVNGSKQWQSLSSAATDETGHYSIENLLPGTYVLHNNQLRLYRLPRPNSEPGRYVYPSSFYPDALTPETAERIEVAAGEESKADVSLHSIRGARVSFTTIPNYPNAVGYLSSGDDISIRTAPAEIANAQVDPSGVHSFNAVSPGHWKIVVRGPFSGRRNSGAEEPMYGELPIEVGTADIENLKVPLTNLADVPVLFSGVTNQQVPLQLLSDGGRAYGLDAGSNGSAKIRGVIPGTYRVVVQPSGNSCVASLLSGSQDLRREPLVVSAGGSTPPIQVVETDNCPQLLINTNASGGATVVIVSDSPAFEPRLATVSDKGFMAKGLSPGEYRIYAFDDATDIEYANPEAMRNFKSQTVQLAAGQKASVQLEMNERRPQ